MAHNVHRVSWRVIVLLCGWVLNPGSSYAEQQETPGQSIGRVSTNGDLIVIELDRAALGQPNLFDLVGRTLRFSPGGSGYRVTNEPLRWDANYGLQLIGGDVSLQRFTFPFSGQRWRSFSVGTTGSIRFGPPLNVGDVDPYGQRDGGIASAIGRFDPLADVGARLGARAPAISVFLKPRMSGPRYVRELADRVVVTWQLTEPFGSLLDFSWFPTTHLFQAVLHRDGSIEMSYKTLAAQDGIVGIYPILSTGESVQSADLSRLTSKSGPFAAVYESFHYLTPPRPQDLSCTVIRALGDKFDFLAYYSDFRIDSQEASSPSDGPIGGNVTGIGDTQHAQTKPILESRCTGGRFQLGFAQPIFVGANEMQEGPPDNAPVGNPKTIAFYTRPLAQAAPGVKPRPYNYAVGHLGHEIGHRWSAYAAARVKGQMISLGAWPHWDPGLQARVAYPYSLPVEASTQGGGVWQDNLDGTFTQLRDGYFVPASGYSHLDLYLMGLIAATEVSDFFIVRPLVQTGTDANGRPIFKGQRMNIGIQDVIAAEGPRLPDVNHSQRHFNTGIVVIVEHGRTPSAELINRANGIRRQWIDYWAITTGGRAAMTVDPH
ncbi:MAG TPA: hypothetical protein VN664_12695 [Burkholderiales bacterium]|nr:hypothetical protein [Burkholderiales bacterium]